jgi:hypothetical protein
MQLHISALSQLNAELQLPTLKLDFRTTATLSRIGRYGSEYKKSNILYHNGSKSGWQLRKSNSECPLNCISVTLSTYDCSRFACSQIVEVRTKIFYSRHCRQTKNRMPPLIPVIYGLDLSVFLKFIQHDCTMQINIELKGEIWAANDAFYSGTFFFLGGGGDWIRSHRLGSKSNLPGKTRFESDYGYASSRVVTFRINRNKWNLKVFSAFLLRNFQRFET